MAELKTKKNSASVPAFLRGIEPEQRRKDGLALLAMFKEVTGMKPVMWGSSIVGFGQYHYKSERSAQEGDWPLVAFSPRKQNLTLYVMPGFGDYGPMLKKLGKHKTSVGCLYINKLDDVDTKVLKQIIKRCMTDMQKRYPTKKT
jgi:hypothetical protein